MSKHPSLATPAVALAFALAALGCAKDPSTEATAATVAEAAPAPAAAPTAAAPSAGDGERVTLRFSNEGSKIGWEGSKVTRSHVGSFEQFAGTIALDPATPAASAVNVTIQTASLVGDVDDLTNHLKSPDFFDVARFPTAEFASTEIREGGGETPGATHTITGNLTLHGVTKQVSFPATIAITDQAVTAKSEFSIDRRDFGLVYPGMPDDLIRDGVVIRLDITANR